MIPTFKAKKIDSDEWVSGDNLTHNLYGNRCIGDSRSIAYVHQINLLTLQISFDGESWNSVEEVADKIKFADRNKWILGA